VYYISLSVINKAKWQYLKIYFKFKQKYLINLMDNLTAYCRVYYDTTNWQKIVHYLNFEDFTCISVLNRAQIINDAFAFLMENQIDRSVFFNLISYLSREKDILPWHPMFRILTSLSEYFPLPESKGLKVVNNRFHNDEKDVA